MLSTFDWLRRSRTGAELLATLRVFAEKPKISVTEAELAAPFSALQGPCQRCLIYSRLSRAGQNDPYCKFCRTIIDRAWKLTQISRRAIVIWGFAQSLPQPIQKGKGLLNKPVLAGYIHDESHFLLILPKRELRQWLQEFVIYHSADLQGLLQIFPTMGFGAEIGMGDILCWAIHHEANWSLGRLRVQFYSAPYQVIKPEVRERRGLLTFEASEFLGLLEMAQVFRALLRPHEQKQLEELLSLNDPKEEQFYWGRFLGNLDQEAKDMLAAWRIRQWPRHRIRLLYELIDYVVLPNSR
jgi:hypothetical protein